MAGGKVNILTFLILFTAMSMLVCIAAFSMLGQNRELGLSLMFNFLINFPMCVIICLLDYRLICLLRRKRLVCRSFHMIVDWLLSLFAGILFLLVVRWVAHYEENIIEHILTFIVWNSIVILGIELFLFHKSILEKETAMARMEKKKAAYQFEALKNQMNPHFLFNSLNALASLAYQDADKTNRFAKKLSNVYRYLLTTYDRPFVTLKEELAFLDSYLYLEKIRFGDALKVEVMIDEALSAMKIVPVSLQLLVENALKHNVTTEEHPLHITVASSDGKLIVSNNLQLRKGAVVNKVGLENLRKQYLIYGREIQVEKTADKFFVAIPLLEGDSGKDSWKR